MNKIFKNRAVIGIICLVLAVIIGFVLVPVVNNLTKNTIEVIRAKQDITMGMKITKDMIEKIEVGKINLPKDTAIDERQVLDKFAEVDLRKGDVFLTSKVKDRLILPENKIRQMKKGEASYTVKLGDSYLSKLYPNDIVTFDTTNEDGEVVHIPELKFVSVITTTTSEGVDILQHGQVGPDGKPLIPDTVTFIMDKKQIDALMRCQYQYGFKLSLRYRGEDMDAIEDFLEVQKKILDGEIDANLVN